MDSKKQLLQTTCRLLPMFFLCLISACSHDFDGYPINGQANVASLSSDGKYVVTSGDSKEVILWDIVHKRKKLISTNANIYSAYFIKHTHDFIWQDLNDIVHVQTVDGKELFSFHNFPTYGQLMSSDLKHYFASDEDWDIYSGYGDKQKLIEDGYHNGDFLAAEKLLNLTLSNNEHYLLTSGVIFNEDYDKLPLSSGNSAYQAGIVRFKDGDFSLWQGVMLWDVAIGKPLFKFPGNVEKTVATFSPDGKYIVTGDEDGHGLVWNALTGKQVYEMYWLCCGRSVRVAHTGDINQDYKWDNTGLISLPKDYGSLGREYMFSIKFIDLDGDYLRFNTNVDRYAVMYNVKDPKPIKYIRLSTYPQSLLVTDDYVRDEAVDTAPAAHILVIAQQNTPGIIVYKYHPKTQTLEKIWAPRGDGWRLFRIGLVSFVMSAILLLFLFINRDFRIVILIFLLLFSAVAIQTDAVGVALALLIAVFNTVMVLIFKLKIPWYSQLKQWIKAMD